MNRHRSRLLLMAGEAAASNSPDVVVGDFIQRSYKQHQPIGVGPGDDKSSPSSPELPRCFAISVTSRNTTTTNLLFERENAQEEEVQVPRMADSSRPTQRQQTTPRRQPSPATSSTTNKESPLARPSAGPNNGPPKKRPNFLGTAPIGPQLTPGTSAFRHISAGAGDIASSSNSASGNPTIPTSSTTPDTPRNIKEIKKSLTLDFTSPESAKKTLQTPDVIRFLQLTSPELERFLKQGTRANNSAVSGAATNPALGSAIQQQRPPLWMYPPCGRPSPVIAFANGGVGLNDYQRYHSSFSAAAFPPPSVQLRQPTMMTPVRSPVAMRAARITMSPSEFYSRYLYQPPRGVAEVTTPTPTQFLFPKNVTDKQRQYAQGFIDALNHLHALNGFVPPQTSLLSPGFRLSPPGDRSRSEEENTETTAPSGAATLSVSPRNSTVTVSPTSALAPPFPSARYPSASVFRSQATSVPSTSSAAAVVAAVAAATASLVQSPTQNRGLPGGTATTPLQQVASVIMQTVGAGLGGFGSGGGLFPPNVPGGNGQGTLSAAMQSIQMMRSAEDQQQQQQSALMDNLMQNPSAAYNVYPQAQRQSVERLTVAATAYLNSLDASYGGAIGGRQQVGSSNTSAISSPSSSQPAPQAMNINKQQQQPSSSYLPAMAPANLNIKQETVQMPPISSRPSTSFVGGGASSLPGPSSSSTIPFPVSSVNLADQELAKLDRKRARNRQAATRCRKRKLDRIDELKGEVQQEELEKDERDNTIEELKAQIAKVAKLVDRCRQNGCSVDGIQLPASHS